MTDLKTIRVVKPEISSSSEEDEAQSVIGSDDERSDNDAHVEIESDGESDAQKSTSACPDESSDEGNTRKKKASSTKQRPKASSSKDGHKPKKSVKQKSF